MRHHEVVEAHQKPEPSPVAGMAPGQTPGAAPYLLMMRLGTMSGYALEAMNRLDLHLTNVRSAFVADTPPLTFQQAHDRVLGSLLRAIKVPSRSEDSRSHPVQRSRS